MSDDWDFYMTRVNDEPASILVNLGVGESTPDATRPILLWVWVHFQNPRDDGFCTEDEGESLWQIEDALNEAMTARCGASLVGRITTCGRREFYYYGPVDRGLEDAVRDTGSKFPVYEFEFGHQPDSDWTHYQDVLYPQPPEMQSIQNRRVVEALKHHGDLLTKPRPVSHWIYFEKADDRQAFIDVVQRDGFEVKPESLSESQDREQPYGVTLERVDAIDYESIDDVVLDLFFKAQEFCGRYDGWETSVERE